MSTFFLDKIKIGVYNGIEPAGVNIYPPRVHVTTPIHSPLRLRCTPVSGSSSFG